MKTRKVIMILFISMSLILGMNIAFADEIKRTTEETRAPISEDPDNSVEAAHEPLIAPTPDKEEKEDVKEYDNVVGEDLPDDTPHILDVGNGEYNPEEAFNSDEKTLESDESRTNSSLSVPVAIAIGLAGLIGIGLVIIKRR
jgi:hypothetical protein